MGVFSAEGGRDRPGPPSPGVTSGLTNGGGKALFKLTKHRIRKHRAAYTVEFFTFILSPRR